MKIFLSPVHHRLRITSPIPHVCHTLVYAEPLSRSQDSSGILTELPEVSYLSYIV